MKNTQNRWRGGLLNTNLAKNKAILKNRLKFMINWETEINLKKYFLKNISLFAQILRFQLNRKRREVGRLKFVDMRIYPLAARLLSWLFDINFWLKRVLINFYWGIWTEKHLKWRANCNKTKMSEVGYEKLEICGKI